MVTFSRLKKAPLVYALCQIRFPPVLKMSDYVPDFQEAIRFTYVNFDKEVMHGFRIGPTGAVPLTSPEEQTRWRFESVDQSSGYLLEPSSLSFHATSYTDFDAFLREILRGFEAISKIAKVSLIQRVGLRYLDLIEGSEANSVQKFVHPLLMGFDPQISGLKAEISQQLFIAKSSLGTLVLRVSVGLHASAIPIELSPLSLNVSRNPDQSNTSIILDTDHFAENLSLTPDSKAIEDLLRQLKLPIAQTFKNSITEFAVKQWDQ